MLGSAKALYLEMLRDREFREVSLGALQQVFLDVGAKELGLPPVALALFLEVKGYDRSPQALRTIWSAIERHCRHEAGWMTVEEARAAGAWTSVQRSAAQAGDF
ncbi:MAG TPA: hypothetical protein VK464_19785 [Symbiobacteriaceae bacterium]|nr:hypothetical protein [Symbiobacteriaceae bacterium]